MDSAQAEGDTCGLTLVAVSPRLIIDRSFWFSFLGLLLAVTRVISGRADYTTGWRGCTGSGPKSAPAGTCYLRVVAERVRADGTGGAIRWSALAFPLWIVA